MTKTTKPRTARSGGAASNIRASDPAAADKTGRPCPICGKSANRAFRPFCSARCADIDLHHWLTGSYAIPAVDQEPGADDEADPADDTQH